MSRLRIWGLPLLRDLLQIDAFHVCTWANSWIGPLPLQRQIHQRITVSRCFISPHHVFLTSVSLSLSISLSMKFIYIYMCVCVYDYLYVYINICLIIYIYILLHYCILSYVIVFISFYIYIYINMYRYKSVQTSLTHSFSAPRNWPWETGCPSRGSSRRLGTCDSSRGFQWEILGKTMGKSWENIAKHIWLVVSHLGLV